MCGASYTTKFIGDCLRGKKLVSLERGVQMLTQEPAELFGLRDRGVIAEGNWADLVIFDPATIDAGDASLVEDLPGGTGRLNAESIGVKRVIVNGRTVVIDDELTGDLPGVVLRSGRDTKTVPIPADA
jgi:N-acyl-D-aspartate/D-glutamate deacylase